MSLIKGERCLDNRQLPRAFPCALGFQPTMRTVLLLSHLLPPTVGSGYDLREVEPARVFGGDPVILTDRFGRILYEWEEGYIPHWLEVRQVCQNLGIA